MLCQAKISSDRTHPEVFNIVRKQCQAAFKDGVFKAAKEKIARIERKIKARRK